jgi:hypothetical protein
VKLLFRHRLEALISKKKHQSKATDPDIGNLKNIAKIKINKVADSNAKRNSWLISGQMK